MKKLLGLVLCTTLMIAAFGGCGEKLPDPTEPTQSVVEVPYETEADERPYQGVTLQYLSMLGKSDSEAAVLRQAADYFEKRTGARVEFHWLEGDEDALAVNFSQGIKADIFETSLTGLEKNYGSVSLDLTELAAAADYESHSYGPLRQQVIDRCGYLSGIVYTPYLYGVYYNLDAFEFSGVTHIPQSWEEYLSACRKLTQGGYVPFTMDVEKAHLTMELHMERSLGIARLEQLMHEGGWRQDEAALELLRQIIDFVDAGYIAKKTPAAFPGGQNKLALSNVAMVVGSNELCAQVEDSAQMDLNWGVFAYPGTGEGTGLMVDSDVLAIHRDCQAPQAAFDFIMLLTTGEFDQLRADVTLGIPADPGNASRIAGAGECLQSTQPRSPGLMEAKDNELYTRIWNGWYKVDSYIANALNQVAYRWVPEETAAPTVPESVG